MLNVGRKCGGEGWGRGAANKEHNTHATFWRMTGRFNGSDRSIERPAQAIAPDRVLTDRLGNHCRRSYCTIRTRDHLR